MKTRIQILFLFLLSSNCFIAKAQIEIDSSDFILKTQSYQDSIVLRWVPKDLTSWRTMNANGISVIRTHLGTSEKMILTPKEIQPYSLEEWKTRTDTTNIYVATAAQCLLGEGKVTKEIANQSFSSVLLASKEQNNTLAFAAMSADFSIQAANGLAFRFVDHKIESQTMYRYELQINGQKVSNTYIQSTDAIWLAGKVAGVRLEETSGSISIYWPKLLNNKRFSGYFVERSTQKGDFKKVSQNIIKATSNTQSMDEHQYIDTDVEEGISYSYRVIGVTSFSDLGLYSDAITGTPQNSIHVTHVKDFAIVTTNTAEAVLKWAKTELVEGIEGYQVLRSDTKLGAPTAISPTLLSASTNSFNDSTVKEGQSYFYSILTVGNNGKTAKTPTKAIVIPDNTPPKSPTGLIGQIDSLGVVSIAWDFGNEEDLKGYRIFRGEDLNQEFRQLTTAPVPGNYYSDTLALNTLKKQVFYKIRALDYKYNPSQFSEVLVLERPDFVAPVSPSGIHLNKQGDSLKLSWNSSPSEDILAYRIHRKTSGENDFTTIAEVLSGTNFYYEDDLKTNETYAYRVTAVDEANNESISSSIAQWNGGPKQLAFTPLLSGNFNKKSKHFELGWKNPSSKDLKIVVYRNSGDGFKWLATIDNSKTTYKDDAFFKNDYGYSYKIQCMDADGNLSNPSNIVQIAFK